MKGNIPVLFIQGDNLPDVWEKSLVSLHRDGCNVKTQYDKPSDPPSKDCTMILTVGDPLAEPMIHRDIARWPGRFAGNMSWKFWTASRTIA